MTLALSVLGWFFYALTCFMTLAAFTSRPLDALVRVGVQGRCFGLLLGVVVVPALHLHPLWILAAFPFAHFVGMLTMGAEAARLQNTIEVLHRKSEQTGIPMSELIARETAKLNGHPDDFHDGNS